jgi:hypothetical protein
MKEYFVQMAITILLATLQDVTALPIFRRPMLKIFRVLRMAYAGDPEFEAVATTPPAARPGA